jgi:DNA-binding transcriptional ArsR family regulator
MTYQKIKSEHNRISILKALVALNFRSNDSMLQNVCERYNNVMSHDEVRTNLGWLAEQGLVTIEKIGNIMNANLTSRGQDVAQGRSFVEGVQRPRA